MSATYKRISRIEFENVVAQFGQFERITVPGSKEIVYHLKTDDENIDLRIYSSLTHDGQARGAGGDSIKIVPWDSYHDRPLGKTKRTHRIETWAKNFGAKVEDLMARIEDGEWEIERSSEESPECPDCGRDMVKREGKYGEFFGCPAFPRCRGTVSLKEWEAIQNDEFVWNKRAAERLCQELEADDIVTIVYGPKNGGENKSVELEVRMVRGDKFGGVRTEDGHFMTVSPDGLFTSGSHFPFVGSVEDIER